MCDHPPVYTCAQARDLVPELTGAAIKNLFLRDRKGKQHFLVVVDEATSVDLAGLSEVLAVTRLSFASEQRLEQFLGVKAGAVGPLAVINDTQSAVRVIIDHTVWQSEIICCHPLVNTATLALKKADLLKFFDATGHAVQFLDVPSQ